MPSPLATALAGPSGSPPGDNSPFDPTAGASNISNFGASRFSPWAMRATGSPATSWAGQQSNPSAPQQPPVSQPGQPGQGWQRNGQPGPVGGIFGGRGGFGGGGFGGQGGWGGGQQPPVPAGAMPMGIMQPNGAAGGGIAAIGRGMPNLY